MSLAARFLASLSVIPLTTLTQACSRSEAAVWSTETVFVSNEDSGDVSALDAASGALLTTISVGKRPRGLRAASDGKQLYVALSGSAKGGPHVDEAKLLPPDHDADGVGVVDVRARRMVRLLKSGTDPETFDISQERALVSNEDSARASVVDLATGSVLASLDVGGEPEGVALRPDGRVGYVTSEADAKVTVVDMTTLQVVAQVSVGQRPRSVAFAPDGSRAFVTNELSGSVSVLDAQRHSLLDTVPLDLPTASPPRSRPMGVAVSPDGERVYVSTGRASGVVELDARRRTVLRRLADVGPRCWGIGLTRDGKNLWVANGPSNDVSLVDVASWRVVKRVPVGKGPWGIALAPTLDH
jgi:YVTN family beta-propeller protein